MPEHLKKIECNLHDLVSNFHYLMIEENAKHFTVNKLGDKPFWFITDVRQDGTYPCHPTDDKGNVYKPLFFDYKERVTIHFN